MFYMINDQTITESVIIYAIIDKQFEYLASGYKLPWLLATGYR